MKNKKILLILAAFVVIAAVGVFGFVLGRNAPAEPKSTDKTAISKTTSKSTDKTTTDQTSQDSDKSARTIVLYFSDANAEFLIPEKREISIDSEPDINLAAVKALIAGPKETGHFPTIPTTMLVQGVKVENGVAVVDFGAAFNNLIPRGEAGEMFFIYSIVDTLTEIDGITKVKFMAGGQIPAVPSSRTDFSAAFTRNDSIVKK